MVISKSVNQVSLNGSLPPLKKGLIQLKDGRPKITAALPAYNKEKHIGALRRPDLDLGERRIYGRDGVEPERGVLAFYTGSSDGVFCGLLEYGGGEGEMMFGWRDCKWTHYVSFSELFSSVSFSKKELFRI